MNSKFFTLAAICVVAVSAAPSQAGVLMFDDVTTGVTVQPIPDGYGGFDWDLMYVVHQDFHPGSGYDHGVVSGDYAAFNAGGVTASVSDGTFDFNGAYLTAAWNNGLNITVEGYQGLTLAYTQTVVVNATGPTYFNFDFLDIDRLTFTSFGGTYAGLGNFGNHFAMDNFTFNEQVQVATPEPGSIILLATGGIGLVGGAIRRRRALKGPAV